MPSKNLQLRATSPAKLQFYAKGFCIKLFLFSVQRPRGSGTLLCKQTLTLVLRVHYFVRRPVLPTTGCAWPVTDPPCHCSLGHGLVCHCLSVIGWPDTSWSVMGRQATVRPFTSRPVRGTPCALDRQSRTLARNTVLPMSPRTIQARSDLNGSPLHYQRSGRPVCRQPVRHPDTVPKLSRHRAAVENAAATASHPKSACGNAGSLTSPRIRLADTDRLRAPYLAPLVRMNGGAATACGKSLPAGCWTTFSATSLSSYMMPSAASSAWGLPLNTWFRLASSL